MHTAVCCHPSIRGERDNHFYTGGLFNDWSDVQRRGQSQEDICGPVQFHGLPQLLWVKPRTVAWPGSLPDTGVPTEMSYTIIVCLDY